MNVALRPYQVDLVTGLRTAMAAGHRRVLGVLPTGGGKGRILAHIPASATLKGSNVLIMAHRSTLVDQISANLNDEDVPHGRLEPGYATENQPVMVGMVQTIARRLKVITPPDLVMIDESHHACATSYRAIMSTWPNARVIGVTATPIRADGQGLCKDFTAMVCGPSTAELIREGFLAQYDYYLPSASLDMDGVLSVRGDYGASAALEVVTKSYIVGDAVASYHKYLSNRPAIAFCIGVDHAHNVAAQFRLAGLRAAAIDGTMPKDEVRAVLAQLASGNLDVLMAADLVSEGVDIPAVAGAILLRPTMSLALHLQQCGRALRPKPDGSRAVILDHVGNATRHGFPADLRRWTLDTLKNKVAAPELRTCPTCFRAFPRKEAKPCGREPCGLDAGERTREIEVMGGKLQLVDEKWAWTGGIDIVNATGRDYARMMQKAKHNEVRLTQIQQMRGYKAGWIWHQMQKL